MRLTFSDDEYYKIRKALVRAGEDELNSLFQKKFKESLPSQEGFANKKKATSKANLVKRKQSKEKIENAINLLRLEGKKITVYSVSKQAKISFNTAKKYEDFITAQSQVSES